MRERARQDAMMQNDEQEAPQVEEEAPRVRFVGGEIPPVEVADASQDPNVAELKQKVARLVREHFSHDYKKTFEHYDGNHDGTMTKDEIKKLLSDAGIGNAITRGAWADGVLHALDLDNDHGVSWAEFESVFQRTV